MARSLARVGFSQRHRLCGQRGHLGDHLSRCCSVLDCLRLRRECGRSGADWMRYPAGYIGLSVGAAAARYGTTGFTAAQDSGGLLLLGSTTFHLSALISELGIDSELRTVLGPTTSAARHQCNGSITFPDNSPGSSSRRGFPTAKPAPGYVCALVEGWATPGVTHETRSHKCTRARFP